MLLPAAFAQMGEKFAKRNANIGTLIHIGIMVIRILHTADTHLGSGLLHGRINPRTGQNTRFEDFVSTLSRVIDRAISEAVDLVLFGGDAFPNATPEPAHQEAFARQFKRLSEANIPTVLLVGNHDLYGRAGASASLNIYTALGVPGFVVGDSLTTHRIETRSGPVQVVTLPWVHRSTLLTKEVTRGMSLEQVDELLVQRIETALEGEIRGLDPKVPSLLVAHAMMDRAVYGAERHLAVGKGFCLPVSLVARSEFEYVALGHVHRHQILCENPPVIYPGSIERVDFGEEKEDKGFMLVEIGEGPARYEFVKLPARSFRTIQLDLAENLDPQTALLKAIGSIALDGCVIRLRYSLHAHQADQIDLEEIQRTLAPAFSYQIQPQMISKLAQPRVPGLGENSTLNPVEALKQYLQTQESSEDLQRDLITAAQRLLEGEGAQRAQASIALSTESSTETEGDMAQEILDQLRLL
jgi:DNA repair protein SbcD/Mre11